MDKQSSEEEREKVPPDSVALAPPSPPVGQRTPVVALEDILESAKADEQKMEVEETSSVEPEAKDLPSEEVGTKSKAEVKVQNGGTSSEKPMPVTDTEQKEDTLVIDEASAQNGHPSEIMTRKRAASLTTNDGPRPKLGRNASPSSSEGSASGVLDDDGEHDPYCWACHKLEVHMRCRICPRSYHNKCIQHDSPETKAEDGTCVCPECVVVMKAENVNHRSDAMQLLNMDQLSSMLKYICGRMKVTPGADAFLKPVSQEDAEDYFEYVKFPMDIAKLETNIKNRQYGSTEAFLADVQWIVHNSIIFNSASSPYSAAAKRLLKVCRQELSEIETCPECYTNAHTKEDWFTEACTRPHILVWAKLKGFPYWPAKAMKVKDDQVDVRFFGQHDRAWVNVKDCYLYSLEQPHAGPKKSVALAGAVDELNQHIAKLKAAFGEVTLEEGKVVMDPTLGLEQIKRMLPKYVPQEPTPLRGSTQVIPKLPVTGTASGTTSTSPKTPVVKLTISSLKTSPTVVSNSAISEEAPAAESISSGSSRSSGSDSEEETIQDPNMEAEEAASEGDPGAEMEVEAPADETKIEGEQEAEVAVTEEAKTDEKESDEASEKEEPEPERQRVPSGILASALGLRRVVKRPAGESEPDKPQVAVRKSLRRASNASSEAKSESSEKSGKGDSGLEKEADIGEKEPIRIKPEFLLKSKQSKAQDLMDQISSQAQTKPGYRFNISKDISISAIGAEGEGVAPAVAKSQNNGTNKVRRIVTTTGSSGGRLVRPAMKVVTKAGGTPSMQVQIQQMTQGKGGANQGQVPRMQVVGKNSQAGGQGGIRQLRPVSQRPSLTGNQSAMVRPTVVVKSESAPVSSVSNTLQMTTAQSISGAITLPGGTITVTPLTPLIAGIPVAPSTLPSSYSTTPTTVNLNGAVNGLPALVPSKSGQIQQATAVVRRTGTVTLPNSVATHMQQCSKGINDLLKTTVEQIAFDILDGGSIAGKIDVSVAQKEKEALVVKHAKEVADLRHSHEIAMRELRVSLENEKRRSLIETKRQCEQEKLRAVEEAKKKQWCARCQREAQFYCCWNTSYCGYHCQEQHWPQHMNICNQGKAGTGNPGEESGATQET